MSYMMWLPFVVLAGWAAGEIAGDGGCGRVSDILLGLSGAFLVRFLVERFDIPLPDINLLLFSVWGAPCFPSRRDGLLGTVVTPSRMWV